MPKKAKKVEELSMDLPLLDAVRVYAIQGVGKRCKHIIRYGIQKVRQLAYSLDKTRKDPELIPEDLKVMVQDHDFYTHAWYQIPFNEVCHPSNGEEATTNQELHDQFKIILDKGYCKFSRIVKENPPADDCYSKDLTQELYGGYTYDATIEVYLHQDLISFSMILPELPQEQAEGV